MIILNILIKLIKILVFLDDVCLEIIELYNIEFVIDLNVIGDMKS
jgi:hypothetical protein